MDLNFDAIPEELKKYPNWVNWILEERNGKLTKIPMNPKTGGRAQSNNPSTWGGYDQVVKKWNECENEHIAGIGFVFSKDDDYSGTDLDHCRNTESGAIEPWAMEVIKSLNSYSEVSPSRTGVKIFTKGNLPIAGSGSKNGNIEMYYRKKFFTVTGWHLEDTPLTIELRQEELKEIYTKHFGHRKKSQVNQAPPTPINTSDSELIQKARQASNGHKFSKLWAGDWNDYPSQSEGDLALCQMLAFWSGRDPTRVDQLFRQSGLMRPKWDEKHFGDGTTYGQATVQKAIEQTTETYSPVRHSEIAGKTALLSPQMDLPPEKILALLGYKCTDFGNAELFKELHGDSCIYIRQKKAWHTFEAGRWKENAEGIVLRMSQTFRLKGRYALAMIQNPDESKRVVNWALGSESQYRIKAALSLAESMLFRSYTEFDKDPWLLCCANTVIDLKTGKSGAARKTDWFYRSTNIPYDESARCERWNQFLSEIFNRDTELIDFIQRAVGYSLTGLTVEQILFILHGAGANGKSVFLSVLENLLGEYAMTTPSSTFKDRGAMYEGIPNDIARLAGARFIKTIEVKENARLNEERIKALTGGDKVTARFLHAEYFDFTPICKFWIAVNHKPLIRGTDEAIWRRIRLIPFEVTFPPEKQDKRLVDKLIIELPGILNWAIRGCLEWQRRGLEPVGKVREVTSAYRAESDLIAQFLEEKASSVLTEKVKASDLYKVYKSWCEEHGEYVITGTQFGKCMQEKGFTKKKTDYVYYLGLELI